MEEDEQLPEDRLCDLLDRSRYSEEVVRAWLDWKEFRELVVEVEKLFVEIDYYSGVKWGVSVFIDTERRDTVAGGLMAGYPEDAFGIPVILPLSRASLCAMTEAFHVPEDCEYSWFEDRLLPVSRYGNRILIGLVEDEHFNRDWPEFNLIKTMFKRKAE